MPPGQPTSLSLLHRLRNNEQDAWQRLVHLYGPLVDGWLRHASVSGGDLEDVRQEVFQAIATSLPAFRRDRDGDSFRGWLRGITRNKLLDHFRHRAQRPEAQGGTDAQLRFLQVPEPEDSDTEDDLSRLYHRALELVRSEFEDRTWLAFWRAAVDGEAPADIAADMGVTAAAVRKAKSRVLRRLKEEVGDLIE